MSTILFKDTDAGQVTKALAIITELKKFLTFVDDAVKENPTESSDHNIIAKEWSLIMHKVNKFNDKNGEIPGGCVQFSSEWIKHMRLGELMDNIVINVATDLQEWQDSQKIS